MCCCENSFYISPGSLTLVKDEWYHSLEARLYNSCSCQYSYPSVTWSSCDPNIASVNYQTGAVCGISEGTTTISAQTNDGLYCDSITVTVKNRVPITSIELDRTAFLIEKGKGYTLSPTIYPSNATNKALSWSSSKESVATVENGRVTGIAKGTAIVTATATDGSGATASCTVTVTTDKLIQDITLCKSSIKLKKDQTVLMTAEIYPANATNQTLTWSSDDTSIATVNPQSGLVRGVGGGTTWINATATDGSGVTAWCSVTVNAPVLVSSITVSPSERDIDVGNGAIFSATVYPSNAANKTLRWHSADTDIAYFQDSSTPVATALRGGSTVIYASAQDGSGVRGYATLNSIAVRVTGVTLSKKSVTIKKSNRTLLCADVKPDGSVTTTVYDNKQRVTSTVEKTASGTVIIGFEYIYDDLSRIIEEKVLANSTKICYTYDSLSRVTERTVKNISGDSVISTETFTYDAAGNVTE